MQNYGGLAIAVVVVLISVIGYYLLRTRPGCTQNDDGACAGVSGDPHMIPGSAHLHCDKATGKLSSKCTAACAVPWDWDVTSQKCVLHAVCQSNADCGAHGTCDADTGLCKCDPGYSGPVCQHATTRCGTPACGYGTCDKGGNCVCPPGHWRSGADPSTGDYVQCLKCAVGWGPGGLGPVGERCVKQWGTSGYLTNNCTYTDDTKSYYPCAEFNAYLNEYNMDDGFPGSVEFAGYCDAGTACGKCDSWYYRNACRVTGYLDPLHQNETCASPGAGDPRPPGSYQCCGSYGHCA